MARQVVGHVNGLNRVLREVGIPLTVLPGMEVGLDPRLPDLLRRKAVLPLNGKRVLLVETPFQQFPLMWEQILFRLSAVGAVVLLAHPERCDQIVRNIELAQELVSAGAKLQVNWDSFSGAHGQDAAATARRLARRGLVHCLATDSHNTRSRHPARFRASQGDLTQLVGPANLRRIAISNPKRVIAGEPPLDMTVDEIPGNRGIKTAFFSIFKPAAVLKKRRCRTGSWRVDG
jgi:protein-tyrosine phosphatase